MEWTWLKDWWRLKKLRRRQRLRRKQKLLHAAHDVDYEGDDGDDEEDFDDECGRDAHKAIAASGGSGADEGRRKRKRLRVKITRDVVDRCDDNHCRNSDCVHKRRDNDGDGSGNEDDGANGDDTNNNGRVHCRDICDDDDDDDEVDDICFCDECFNGDTDLCESNDGMDSDCSTSSNCGKQVLVGICAMAKKTQSKPMKEILTRLQEFEFIKMVIFQEDVILKEPVENWPVCDCLISFHSKGFPLEKAIQYAQLRQPFVLNNLHMQYDIQDRRRVYAILEKEGIEIPRYAVLDRDSPDPKQHELIESEDHVEVNGIIFNKPFVEKPVSAEDHNIYIYYPTSAGGGSQRLFRKIGSRSSVYSPESRVRKTGSFIYEDFMPTDGTDVKVYTVGPDYAHAEARKSPALDGKVERDSEGKEIRYPVILNHAEKLISRKVCLAFKQTVCGFDLLRANGKSFVCDVNGFSFVKNSNKYYDDCAKILGNMILRELTPTLHIPWSVPFQLDDPPIVPTTFGKMMELRCVVAVIRHGDRTPKQKMKVEVRHPKFFEIFDKYDGYKHGHVKLKRPKQLQEILDIARFLLAEIQTKGEDEIEEKQSKLEQLKSVLEMYGHFSGINRKVQMKYQPKGRPRGSSSDDVDAPKEPSLVLILKWGGELTPAGRIQAEELGRIFRCMYPGGQGRQDYSGTQGLGLLRLHSTFRHDLKIYASDEGRVQMTAAAFAKGLLALEGELTPILVQMVKSANTNGLLDNDCDSSKYQNMAKNRLHELMRIDRDFTPEDRLDINPCNSISINQALDFVKNPVDCCNHVHDLIKELLEIISIKKDDPKTKDAILYHGETWDLMGRRWEKIEKDFSTKSKLYDISKVPDIYDCIKYDLQHNQHTLQYDQAEELYIYAKYLADIVIPQEYGLTVQEKLTIGQGICTPLLKKIQADLQRNIEEVGDESVNRLNPHYSHGVASPGRHVRTRLYFTSESHVHSLLTVLRYGELLNVLTDEQWRRAMDYISMVSELNYMSQIVIMLYEDPTKDPTSEERFHVELHFSPGVNCCVQKNLPPGPGFRPHSRNDSGQLRNAFEKNAANVAIKINPQATEDGNTPRIDEENDLEDSGAKTAANNPSSEEKSELTALPPQHILQSRHTKSKPIPIGAHHTVCGHEAMDLAKRLNEELAVQQQTKQTGSLEAPCPISPNAEPRSRSYDQHDHKGKTKDSNTPSAASSSSVSSRRQRHSIAGQMSYMKMLGFGGFSKKMATSSNSLFSTAVISGSSSAPNLRDMIPCTSSSSVIEGFGGVPPIRPLETLHNALSLKQLDNYLQKMTSAPLFKTPASSPPKHVARTVGSLFGNAMGPSTDAEAVTPTNQFCRCHRDSQTVTDIPRNTCCACGCLEAEPTDRNRQPQQDAATPRQSSGACSRKAVRVDAAATPDETPAGAAAAAAALAEPAEGTWSKQTSVATSTEPSSPAISDSCSQDTPSGEMSISLTSTEDGVNIPPAATEELAKFFPQLDDDLHSVSIYAPMNTDTLNADLLDASVLATGGSATDRSNCLTPISVGLDISMVANKGSITLSVDGLDEDDEMTLSAATTPSLPMDEYKLETCYCCPSHADIQPVVPTTAAPEATSSASEAPVISADDKVPFPDPLPTPGAAAAVADSTTLTGLRLSQDASNTFAPVSREPIKRAPVRKSTDPISPRIQKQISLFEGDKELFFTISSSMNFPTQSLQLDARLRKFENLTQSTSNSNFPFESNTLKKSSLPNTKTDDMDFTKSCINLKSSGTACTASSASSSPSGSPQRKEAPPAAATATTTSPAAEAYSAQQPAAPHPGAFIVKAKFIEPPRRIKRSFRGKTQSMDAGMLLPDFLTVPPGAGARQHSPSSGNTSPCSSPSARSATASRFVATKVLDDALKGTSSK